MEGLDVATAAEVEASKGGDENDGLQEVEDVEDDIVEEGEADGDALPPPRGGKAELPRPAVVLVQPLEPSVLRPHCRRRRADDDGGPKLATDVLVKRKRQRREKQRG